jgi:hypothetical protein
MPQSLRIDGWTAAATCLAGVIVGVCFWRLYYGVDFTDEAYYVAVPYRFVLDARPYIDETTPSQQTTGLLLYPLVAAYHAAFGVHGIILAGRRLHLLFACLVAACAYLGLRPFVRTQVEAVVPSVIPIAFVPFSLPDLSYNNVGSGCLVAGTFLGLRFLGTGRRRFLALAGLANGLATFAYPTLVVATVGFAVLIGVLAGGPRARNVVVYSAPAAIPIFGLFAVFAHAGTEHVRAVYEHAREFGGQGGGVEKLLSAPGAVTRTLPHAPLGLVAVACLIALWRLRPTLAPWLASALPLLLFPLVDARQPLGSLTYMTLLGMAALPLYPLVRADETARMPFRLVWLTALLGGLATFWSSNNGGPSFGLGFAGASIVTTMFVMVIARGRPALAFLSAATAVALATVMQFTWVYRDNSFGRLGSRIGNGPYAGLFTSPARRRFVTALQADLLARSSGRCRILFFDEFPAGYLMSPSRPYTNAALMLGVARKKVVGYRRLLLAYYRAQGALPDVVVRISHVPGDVAAAEAPVLGDPLAGLLDDPRLYRVALERPDYTLYRRRGAPCRS